MNESLLTALIKDCTVGDKIDLKKICQALHISLKADPELKDLCKIGIDDKHQNIIWINPNIDAKTRFTLIAIALAEFILHPERISGIGITYDIFSLADLHRTKHAPYMMLATRLTIPEHIIKKLVHANEMEFTRKSIRDNTDVFDKKSYIENSIFLPEFIESVVKESTGRLLLDNIHNHLLH